MLDKIIHFSIKNKMIIGLLTLALIIWGSFSVTKLPIDAVPDITNNQVQVITVSPSLAAEDIERLVTFPVEQSMANIPGIEEVRSFSRFGLSVVTIVFKDDIDVYWARQQVNERLNEAKTIIPQGVGIPELAPVTTGLGEIYQYVIHTKEGYENKYSPMELRTIQDWIVRRQLLGTEGVADVSSFGGYLKQYEIALNPDKLRSMNISINDVFTALKKNNQNTGGAYIDKKPNAYFIKSEGLIGTKEDIEKIVVKVNPNGIPVLIRNVANVGFGHATRYGAMTRSDKGEVVGAIVMMLKGANSSEVIYNVKERITQIEKNLPEGVVIEPFLDRTKLINNAISTVTKNLAEGALIVIFVLVLLLGNFRAGLIVASVIPLAMLFAISLMNLFGVSGNLMSLGAIDFGLIVDGAVIIVEATLHHLTGRTLLQKFGGRRLSQEEMNLEVYESASKIRSSAAFGEIIILIVYLPILALVGVEGKMFKPMAQTVSFAILGAFILSLTYVPMAAALFLNKNTVQKRNISDRIMDFFQNIYKPMIHLALKRKAAVLITAVLMFIFSIAVFMRMGGEFIPTLDEGDFAVETRVLQGSSISQTIEAALRAAKILQSKFPEIKEVIGKVGSGEIPTDPMPVEACDVMIILKDKSEWTSAETRDELAEKMSKALEDIPGVTFGFQQPIQMRFNELMTGARQDVVIKVYGEDLNTLTDYANKLGKIASTIEGAQDVYVEQVTGQSQIVVKFDRDKISQFGLNIEDVNQVIKAGFAGDFAGFVYEGEKRFDMVVRLEKENRQSIEDIKGLFVTAPNGNQVPVSQLAEVEMKTSPNQIQRDDAKRRITVGFNVRGRDVESVVKEMQSKVDKDVKFSAGYFPTYGGTFKNLIEARQRLSIAVPVALLLIFMLLFFTFHSFKQSILIFTAIPLSAIGGVFALWLRDMPFSISAGVGFIALFGVAVLNGIVLIAEFNRLKTEGMTDIKEIIFKGTSVRLRPVIMTALVASLGFLPMALSQGSGAEVQKPLATVVIGGVLTATLLTLLVLPVLYWFFEKIGKTKPNIPVNVSVIILLMLLPALSNAQTSNSISLQQAIDGALKNNATIKAGNYEVDYSKALKKASTDIGKTNVSLQYGQYNSIKTDNNISISQSIPFPTLFSSQSQLNKAHIKGSELKLQFTQNELINQVKSVYHYLEYLQAERNLLLGQDSIYSSFANASNSRFKVGENTLLEKTTAETQLMEIKNLLAQNQSNISIYQSELAALMNSKVPVQIEQKQIAKLELNIPSDSTAY
jgi:heavy metal efflux system protein